MVNLLTESTKENLLLQQDTALCTVCIYDNQDYRWLTFNDQAIQSVMSKADITKIVAPVNQAMLLFLLWPEKPLSVLNLGLGGASLERALLPEKNITLTSVEINSDIIEFVRQYFSLDKKHSVYIDSAEQYISYCKNQYDVILIDIFAGEQHADCLYDSLFWQNIKSLLTGQQQVFINFRANSNKKLHRLLTKLRHYFSNIAIIEFNNFINLTLIVSKNNLDKISLANIKNSSKLNLLTKELPSHIKEIFHLDTPR